MTPTPPIAEAPSPSLDAAVPASGGVEAVPIGKQERQVFEAWAASEWHNSNPPDSAWKGWIARAQFDGKRASLSPAQTSGAEAGGEIDLTIRYLRCADDDLASAGEKVISTRFSNVRAVIRDAIAVLERRALAQPASEPAGGGVREAELLAEIRRAWNERDGEKRLRLAAEAALSSPASSSPAEAEAKEGRS